MRARLVLACPFSAGRDCRAQVLWRSFAFGYGYSMAGTWWIANALLVEFWKLEKEAEKMLEGLAK